MEKKIDVLAFGDVCVDLIISGHDVVPEFEQKEKMVDDYSLEMGGSGPIFACQAAKLGLKTVLAGKVGNDMFGEVVCRTLEDAGVSLDYIIKDNSLKTGVTVALNTGNDRAMLTYSGTIDSIEPKDIDFELLKSVRHLHIDSYFLIKKLQPYYMKMIETVKANGGTVSLDTNWDPDENWDSGVMDVIRQVDIIFPNENEAKALMKEDDVQKALDKLKQIVPIVAVKMGKDGAVTHYSGNIVHTPAVDVEKVDAVGAGDSFDGGFLYGYLTGKSIEECARIGCICGSLNTRAPGGTKGQPRLDEMKMYNKV